MKQLWGQVKKNKLMVKNIIFCICLIVLALQFKSSFTELTDLVDTNQPYVEVSTYLYSSPLVEVDFEQIEIEETKYVTVNTLRIYTYKLFQTILLLFGMFMCLIFMASNNRDFSLVDTLRELEKK